MRNTYKVSVVELKGRELERCVRRREDNIKLYLRKTGCEVADWIHLTRADS